MSRRRDRSRRSRAALWWGLAFFVMVQVAVRHVIQTRPEVADREFGRKVSDLRRRRIDAPARPLVLMLGSSRVATGFRPGVLGLNSRGEKCPLFYNFAQVGSGPEMAHLSLHRLLTLGIRPDWVLVEFWPPTFGTERTFAEFAGQIHVPGLDAGSLRLLARYVARPGRLYRSWLSAQLAPASTSRAALLHWLAPTWLVPAVALDRRCRDLDSLGWWSPTTAITLEERGRLEERYRRMYEPRLRRFRVASAPDRALRAILALCRREGIPATVVVLPESESFRALSPEPTRRDVQAYLDRIRRDCGVEVVDARSWVGDDGFIDGHHLLPEGATTFTRRLEREVFTPALAILPTPRGR